MVTISPTLLPYHLRIGLFMLFMLPCMPGCKSTGGPSSDVLIYGGEEVNAATDPIYRSTVSIQAIVDGAALHWCSATPIDAYHIVSAAHCFADQGFTALTVGFGSNPSHSKQVKISHIAYPQKFWGSAPGHFFEKYDIAILTLATPLPAELAAVAMATDKSLPVDTVFTQAGFGYNIIDEKNTDYPNYGKLLKLTTGHLLAPPPAAAVIKDFSDDPWVFIVNPGPEKTTMHGDSGGPAFRNTPHGLMLQGVLRGGFPANTGNYDIYTNVAYYAHWLSCTAQGSSHPLDPALQVKGDADQYPCQPGDTAIPLEQFRAHNETICQQWAGWKLLNGRGNLYSCGPATEEACNKMKIDASWVTWDAVKKQCQY